MKPEERVLDEENAKAVLDECMQELGTLFGTNAESLQVGITGIVNFVELDGPTMVVSLSGRFWHERSRVIERVNSFVLERIPECVGVEIVDEAQLDDTDPTELELKLAEVDAAIGTTWLGAPEPTPSRSDVPGADGAASVWEEHHDPESSLPYYFNRQTGESVWERPAALDA